MDLDEATARWEHFTGKLPYGVQKVFKDTLELVKSGDVTVAWGADYFDGSACLVNATAHMLKASGGSSWNGMPTEIFREVVTAFDSINHNLLLHEINENKIVSPEAAHYLLTNFGKEVELPKDPNEINNQVNLTDKTFEWFDQLKEQSTI